MSRRKGTSLAISLAAIGFSLVIPGVHAQDASGVSPLTAKPLTKDWVINECRGSLSLLTLDANAKGALLKEAQQQGAVSKDICRLATDYEQTELKLVQFIQSNSRECGVPPEFRQTVYRHHEYTKKVKTKLCTWRF